MTEIDTLLNARWIVPVEPDGVVLDHHSIAISDGRIHDVLPSDQARTRYRAPVDLDLNAHILIPGLVNTHTHAGMNLFRGLADDLPLMEWLNNHIWPVEKKWVNEEFMRVSVQLAVAEMLRSGTTCFSDMFYFPEITARTAAGFGMRVCVGMIVLDFPTAYATSAEEYISKGLIVHDEHKNEALITTAFAPHAPYTVSDESLKRVRTYADELDVPVHMHVHETDDEIAQSLASHGRRPLQRLNDLGLVSPALLAVHMTHLDDSDIALCAESGAHVLHCPESNLKLASGFCPVQRLLDAGVNVGLGTDSVASNNDLDMLGELGTAALLAKGIAGDATALPARSALRLATLNGATALGLGDEIGSLRVGKSADIVAITLNDIECIPYYDPISQLVYAAGRDKVSDVWIAGQHLLKERQLTTINEAVLKEQVREWNARIESSPH